MHFVYHGHLGPARIRVAALGCPAGFAVPQIVQAGSVNDIQEHIFPCPLLLEVKLVRQMILTRFDWHLCLLGKKDRISDFNLPFQGRTLLCHRFVAVTNTKVLGVVVETIVTEQKS